MKNKGANTLEAITLEDNQHPNKYYTFVSEGKDGGIEDGHIPEVYKSYIESVGSVNKLIKEHNAIIVPKRERFEKDTAIEIRNSKIYTYNWVGVISTPTQDENSRRIEITSRFDTSEKQYFLLYLLSSVYGVNIFNIDVNSEKESNYIIILIILFLSKIVEAYGSGLYKEYNRSKYNDYNFKGSIDIDRHIKLNTPFMGKTSYKIREYSYDNEILYLMRQVLDYIICNHFEVWEACLNNELMLNEIVSVIENATPSYRMNINYADTISCRREITHPMYQGYEEARKLAIMILSESGQNIFDNSKKLSFSLLIDISWLWEEFVAEKLLKECNYKHVLTDGSAGTLEWSNREYWYPDFIEEGDEHKRRNIFDAKYKFWDWGKDDDIHQLLSYLLISGGNKCGIIYPDNKSKTWSYQEIHSYEKFYGNEHPKIYKMPMYIHYGKDMGYLEYCRVMEESIKKWKENFQNLLFEI